MVTRHVDRGDLPGEPLDRRHAGEVVRPVRDEAEGCAAERGSTDTVDPVHDQHDDRGNVQRVEQDRCERLRLVPHELADFVAIEVACDHPEPQPVEDPHRDGGGDDCGDQ